MSEVPGPVMTVSMADKTLEVRLASGIEVCNSMLLSDTLRTIPLDVPNFKSLINDILADVPFANTLDLQGVPNGFILPLLPMQCTESVILKVNHVYNDNGVPLVDKDDISCLTRLTIGTIGTTDPSAYRSLREAAFIEHHLSMYRVNKDPISQTQVFMRCLRHARDFVTAMAADINKDVFIASLKPVYEELGGWNNDLKGKLLLAYYKQWPETVDPPAPACGDRRGGPRPPRGDRSGGPRPPR